MSVSSTIIPDDAPCSHEKLLTAMKADNLDEFQEAMSIFTDFDIRVTIEKNSSDTVPWMVLDVPPLSCLCAFLAAEQCFNYLLILGIDFEAEDANGRTLGQFAVAGGSMEIIRLIDIHAAENNSDIFEWIDAKGNSCSHFAAKFGRMDALQWLWTKGIKLNPRNDNGGTPFMWSCSSGQLEMAKFLVERGARINELTSYGRWSPIHYAVAHNQLETTKFLLDQKSIEIDMMRANYGPTPVMTAIENDAFDCVKLLVEHGCSFEHGLYKKNPFEPLPIHPIVYAAAKQKWEIMQYLMDEERAWSTLGPRAVPGLIEEIVGVEDNDSAFRAVCEKLRNSPEKTAKTDFGVLIASAIRSGCSTHELDALLSIGCVAVDYTREQDQMTFLHVAAQCNNEPVVKYLVGKKVNINAVSDNGHTALMWAISKKHAGVAEYLAKQKNLDVTIRFRNLNYLEVLLKKTKKDREILERTIAVLQKKL